MDRSFKISPSIQDGNGNLFVTVQDIIEVINEFTSLERLELFSHYCEHCGRIRDGYWDICSCCNDV